MDISTHFANVLSIAGYYNTLFPIVKDKVIKVSSLKGGWVACIKPYADDILFCVTRLVDKKNVLAYTLFTKAQWRNIGFSNSDNYYSYIYDGDRLFDLLYRICKYTRSQLNPSSVYKISSFMNETISFICPESITGVFSRLERLESSEDISDVFIADNDSCRDIISAATLLMNKIR